MVPTLSDLELAVLLSLVAKQHCLVYTSEDLIEDVAEELGLIVTEVFDLNCAILEPECLQSRAMFGEAVLDDNTNPDDSDLITTLPSRSDNAPLVPAGQGSAKPKLDARLVVNVVIAKHFDVACEDVQFQVLEMIGRNRIVSKTTVHPTPTTFLFIPINDRFFMSHHHVERDGFPFLEGVHGAPGERTVPKKIIDSIRERAQAVEVTSELRRYLQDMIVFLRVERDVDGGVTPNAGVNLLDLAKYLAPLHDVDFVMPSLVILAARKVYLHRLILSPWAKCHRTQKVFRRHPEDVIDSVLTQLNCLL
ncbi:hypothetical protein DV735_g2411, partial [Chaetothyriales sp. CBS 134920]